MTCCGKGNGVCVCGTYAPQNIHIGTLRISAPDLADLAGSCGETRLTRTLFPQPRRPGAPAASDRPLPATAAMRRPRTQSRATDAHAVCGAALGLFGSADPEVSVQVPVRPVAATAAAPRRRTQRVVALLTSMRLILPTRNKTRLASGSSAVGGVHVRQGQGTLGVLELSTKRKTCP